MVPSVPSPAKLILSLSLSVTILLPKPHECNIVNGGKIQIFIRLGVKYKKLMKFLTDYREIRRLMETYLTA